MKYRDDPATYHKEYYEKNKEKAKERSRQYYVEHKDKILDKEKEERRLARAAKPPRVARIEKQCLQCRTTFFCKDNKRERNQSFCSRECYRLHTLEHAPFHKGQPCIVDACGKPAHRKGLCSMHDSRLARYGDVHNPGNPRRLDDPEIQQKARALLRAVRQSPASRREARQRSLEQWEIFPPRRDNAGSLLCTILPQTHGQRVSRRGKLLPVGQRQPRLHNRCGMRWTLMCAQSVSARC